MKHINYFDMGLWKYPHEIEMMINEVFPKLDNITYSIYGFEAHPEYVSSISQMYSNLPNVKIINLAISNKKGDEKLYMNEANGIGNSIFKTKANVNPNVFFEVESNTFSGWLTENNIDLDNSINILKVNIEGSELHLWEDFKNSGIRNKFQILCGHPQHDILKVSELKEKVEYYFSLLSELNIQLLRFCGESNPHENIDMVETIKKYL